MKAELDWAEVPYPDRLEGRVTSETTDDHDPHGFLYVPDLSSMTGWSAHKVPERQTERTGRREMGFRR